MRRLTRIIGDNKIQPRSLCRSWHIGRVRRTPNCRIAVGQQAIDAINHRSYTLLFLRVEYISRRYVQTSQQ